MATASGNIVGAPTFSGEVTIDPSQKLIVKISIQPDWVAKPLTGRGEGSGIGETASRKIEGTPLRLYEPTTFDELREVAKLFDIETYHTGYGKDDPFSIISFYNEGYDKRVASAVVKPSLEIRSVKKGDVKWNVL